MLYFIPAWYQQDQWCENEQKWYMRRMHTEFDDTVKQIQLFHRNEVYPYRIMLLSCAPNFRHFLHRQSVYHAPYWSCFDAIQEIRRKKAMVLSFHNLNWPPHTEFIYTPFVVIAMLHGVRYAQLEFGEDGNLIQIDMYEEGKLRRTNIYDDRGFISSTILYEDETPFRQDYLMENGVWKLRHYIQDGHVEINPNAPNYLLVYQDCEKALPFLQLSYESLDLIIEEVLTSYLKLVDEEDIFCVAMHERHAVLIQEALKGRKMILSFFEDRYDLGRHPEMLPMVEQAAYVIADSQENRRLIKGQANNLLCIKDITPFDSRVDFGISQQLNVQKILVPVDNLEDEVFAELIRALGTYLPENKNAQIHLLTRQAEYDRKSRLLSKTRECLKRAGMEEAWAAEQRSGNIAENNLEDEDQVTVRFYVEQCVDELSVSKCMREQRLVVDMRSMTEVYLRINAISVGIPQIVRKKTQFVEHGKNGYVVQDTKQIPELLEFYLGSLTNWNEAMVYSYEVGKKYTTDVLLREWKEVIEVVRKDPNPAAGK
ncbi:MAG: accessory Sec system protein Asp1 [Lachnospiraceae bacterium]|nr:accessory Sec system protein Asp1 [Lachnospiraceae bacterium]